MVLSICVLGNGGFGTALARHAALRGHDVRLWGHDPDYTQEIAEERTNERYLPGVEIPSEIDVGSDPKLLRGVDVVLVAVPTQHVRGVFETFATRVPKGLPIVSCSKGLEERSGLLPTQVLKRLAPQGHYYVLTGPCHAEELARDKPASVLLAGSHGDDLERIQEALSGPTFRIYRSQDALGAELGGAVKNVIAIAAGICDGLQLGDNAKAALLTRGLAEIARFGVALGASQETFFGLAGLGDLITTAVSPHGRNRALGEEIGRGRSLEEILASTRKVAEGVWTCRAVLARCAELDADDRGIDMPIAEQVAEVLFEGKDPAATVHDLMTRLLRGEF